MNKVNGLWWKRKKNRHGRQKILYMYECTFAGIILYIANPKLQFRNILSHIWTFFVWIYSATDIIIIAMTLVFFWKIILKLIWKFILCNTRGLQTEWYIRIFIYFEYRSKKCQCMQHAQLQYDYEWFDKENINNKILCFEYIFVWQLCR